MTTRGRLRSHIKNIIFNKLPLTSGKATYFGHKIFFPRNCELMHRLAYEGVFEGALITAISAVTRPETTFIDIGANVGLISVPILARNQEVCVLSVEPSPITSKFLRRTHAISPYRQRWLIHEAAVGDHVGEVDFFVGASHRGAYDGILDTGRGGDKASVRVRLATLDSIWSELAYPEVSSIKIDIEGGEVMALMGAKTLLSSCEPSIFLEWNKENLAAYGVSVGDLFGICSQLRYRPFSLRSLSPINDLSVLFIELANEENLILVPTRRNKEEEALSLIADKS